MAIEWIFGGAAERRGVAGCSRVTVLRFAGLVGRRIVWLEPCSEPCRTKVLVRVSTDV
jgi:hypothetical protein